MRYGSEKVKSSSRSKRPGGVWMLLVLVLVLVYSHGPGWPLSSAESEGIVGVVIGGDRFQDGLNQGKWVCFRLEVKENRGTDL